VGRAWVIEPSPVAGRVIQDSLPRTSINGVRRPERRPGRSPVDVSKCPCDPIRETDATGETDTGPAGKTGAVGETGIAGHDGSVERRGRIVYGGINPWVGWFDAQFGLPGPVGRVSDPVWSG